MSRVAQYVWIPLAFIWLGFAITAELIRKECAIHADCNPPCDLNDCGPNQCNAQRACVCTNDVHEYRCGVNTDATMNWADVVSVICGIGTLSTIALFTCMEFRPPDEEESSALTRQDVGACASFSFLTIASLALLITSVTVMPDPARPYTFIFGLALAALAFFALFYAFPNTRSSKPTHKHSSRYGTYRR